MDAAVGSQRDLAGSLAADGASRWLGPPGMATPVFVRYEELTRRSFRVFYDDYDAGRLLREEQVAPGEAGP